MRHPKLVLWVPHRFGLCLLVDEDFEDEVGDEAQTNNNERYGNEDGNESCDEQEHDNEDAERDNVDVDVDVTRVVVRHDVPSGEWLTFLIISVTLDLRRRKQGKSIFHNVA